MSKNKDNGIIFKTRVRGLDGQRIKAFLRECGISDTKPSQFTIEQFTLAAVRAELDRLRDAYTQDAERFAGRTQEQLEERAEELNKNADEWESGELGESEEHAVPSKETTDE